MKWNSLRKTYMHTWLRAPTTCKATLEILSLNFSKSISWTEIIISQVSSILILYWFPVIFQIFHGLLPIFQICMSFCHYLVVITYFTAIITLSFQIIACFILSISDSDIDFFLIFLAIPILHVNTWDLVLVITSLIITSMWPFIAWVPMLCKSYICVTFLFVSHYSNINEQLLHHHYLLLHE